MRKARAEMDNSTQAKGFCRSKVNAVQEDWDAITSWSQFEEAIKELKCDWNQGKMTNWSFRGEGTWCNAIESSLEKAAIQNDIALTKLYDDRIEQGLIRRFKRDFARMPHYQPESGDHMAWLAIMQHHGAPTRLVDISYSIYIALYFALWRYKAENECAVWCFSNEWLNAAWDSQSSLSYKSEYKRDTEGRYYELFRIVLQTRKAGVYLLNPYNPPERLILQQGGFIIPLDIGKSFMDNLFSMPIDPKAKSRKHKWDHRVVRLKICLSKGDLQDVRYKLARMNINNATLFPGIDGFSRSLYDYIPFDILRSGKKKGF